MKEPAHDVRSCSSEFGTVHAGGVNGAGGAKLAVGADGSVRIVWWQDVNGGRSNDSLIVAVSRDSGGSWSREYVYSVGGAIEFPAVTVDDVGRLHVVFVLGQAQRFQHLMLDRGGWRSCSVPDADAPGDYNVSWVKERGLALVWSEADPRPGLPDGAFVLKTSWAH